MWWWWCGGGSGGVQLAILEECSNGNVCRSRSVSNSLAEEQRANLSTPRLGHQTGHNQLPHREREEGQEGHSEVAAAGGGGKCWCFFFFFLSFDTNASLLLKNSTVSNIIESSWIGVLINHILICIHV